MGRIDDLEAFVAIVDQGSLTAAARSLDRSLQAVSRSLATLEDEVGVQLVHRTTRRCATSEAGQAFYQRVKPALASIRHAKAELAERRREPSGRLRVGAPVLFGPDFLVPIIAQFMRRYPRVEIDLQLADAFVDPTSQGLDLVIRIAELADSGLQGRRLGALRRVVFGAPSYFERHGRPRHPTELGQHCCVIRTVDRDPGQWTFSVDGKAQKIGVNGAFRCNSMPSIYTAVVEGLGLGYSPLWPIRHLIDQGKIEVVLQEFEPRPVPIHALWQQDRRPPAKVRAFIDLLVQSLRLDGV